MLPQPGIKAVLQPLVSSLCHLSYQNRKYQRTAKCSVVRTEVLGGRTLTLLHISLPSYLALRVSVCMPLVMWWVVHIERNLTFLVWLLLSRHCECRGLFFHLITLRHTTLRRTPLDEGSACSTDLYLKHDLHKRQTSMSLGEIRTHSASKPVAADLRH
jgi:hypothetical protein